jgi:hypothetical protein
MALSVRHRICGMEHQEDISLAALKVAGKGCSNIKFEAVIIVAFLSIS